MTTTEAVANATEAAPAVSEFKTRAVQSEISEPEKAPEVPSEQPEIPAEPADEQGETTEAEAAPDESDDAEAEEHQDERKPLPKGVQRKINKLTRRVGEFADENRELKQRLAEIEQGQVQQKPTEATPTGEPKLEDFDFDNAAFNRAHYKWLRDQEKQTEAVQTRQKRFTEQEDAFRAEHPDYDDVAKSPDVPITRDMVMAIVDTDNPPAIAYYLGQNPEEAEQIAGMSAIAAARAIGRIEAKLTQAPKPAPVLPKKTTNAPPPPKTVSGAGKAEVSVDDPNLSTAQRIALWKKQKGK